MTRFFWKSWNNNFRYPWYVAAGLLLASLLFMWYSYIQGNNAVIHWGKLQEQKSIESVVHTFSVGPFELSVPAENFVIYEYFNGSTLQPNTTASLIYLALIVISAVIILAVITTLDRFWFTVGMVLFILFLYSLRLKVLGIFGQSNYIPVITISIIMTGCSVFFNMFRKDRDVHHTSSECDCCGEPSGKPDQGAPNVAGQPRPAGAVSLANLGAKRRWRPEPDGGWSGHRYPSSGHGVQRRHACG
jgi:hypothetical protein